jgi:hypothetical protein
VPKGVPSVVECPYESGCDQTTASFPEPFRRVVPELAECLEITQQCSLREPQGALSFPVSEVLEDTVPPSITVKTRP